MPGTEITKHPDLIVGIAGSDDAAVYRISDDVALVQTVDFFTPIVDNPGDWGRIAASNALSDIYAMGGTPLTALQLLSWPRDELPWSVAADVIDGAVEVLTEAKCTLVGGHSIDDQTPKFGFAITGTVHPDRFISNDAAHPGDLLILTKALGTGLIATAIKKGEAEPSSEAAAVASMRRLNSAASRAAVAAGVRAGTDVTGFGLLGHLREMAAASGAIARVDFLAVPQITDLAPYLEAGAIPGGTRRNWASYGDAIDCPDESIRHILCDPQTSGGILTAIDPAHADGLIALFGKHGLAELAKPIGEIEPASDASSLVRVVG